MRLGEVLTMVPLESAPSAVTRGAVFQADRGPQGQYLVVTSSAAKAGSASLEGRASSTGSQSRTASMLPDVDVLGIHYIQVQPNRAEAFEQFVARTLHPAMANLRPDLRLLYYKAVAGPDAARFIALFALTRGRSRDKVLARRNPTRTICARRSRPCSRLPRNWARISWRDPP